MSKKIISLLLCLIMLAGLCLVSCGDDEIATSTPIDTRSLSMYLISDKTVFDSEMLNYVKDTLANPNAESSDKKACNEWVKTWVPEGKTFDEFYEEQIVISKQYDAVEEQVNLITTTQYSVKLDLRYFSEEDYYKYVDIYMGTDRADGYTGMIAGSVAVENENGVPEYVYPEVPDDHVDILFIGEEEYFNKFYEEGKLSALDLESDNKYKPLTKIIYPSYMQAVTRYSDGESKIYAIPNNIPVGEYTYMLINKEYADTYKLDPSTVTSWKDCVGYLDLVAQNEDCVPILLNSDIAKENGTVALGTLIEEYVVNNHYWSISYEEENGEYSYSVDPDKFSLLGASYKSSDTQNGISTKTMFFDNMLRETTHRNQLASLMYFNNNGYFDYADEDDKVALSLFKGTNKELEEYKDDYYTVLLEVPRVNGADAYKGMFAVSSQTTNVKKSLQIISYITTNADFRNLIQYGIEGENYTLDEEGYVISLEGNHYNMDVEKTGNIFTAYASDDTYSVYDENGELDVWADAKQIATDAVVHPLLGFSINKALEADTSFKLDNSAIENLSKLSDEYLAKLSAMEKNLTVDQIASQLQIFADEFEQNNDFVAKLRSSNYSVSNQADALANGTSVYDIYSKWLVRNGFALAAQ